MLIVTSWLGLVVSFALISLLRPALPPFWRWSRQGVVLHVALWMLLHGLLGALLGRPWFSMALGLAFLMLLIQISNAKYHALREPFVFQDFEYFTDAIRHPRLYIPFLGWWKFALITVAVLLALATGMWLEAAPGGGEVLDSPRIQAALLLLLGMGLTLWSAGGPEMTFSPQRDMGRLGFVGLLWRYGWAERLPLQLSGQSPKVAAMAAERPDLLVVQSESFFDPRQLFSGIRPDVLAEFDRIKAEALMHGRLAVPAWGANTVRSEFAFLAGVPEEKLGVHRFNPYRQILKSDVTTVARMLKAAGYRTICLHPYPASFYQRDQVFPHLGFDEFLDIRAFAGAARCGPYVSDQAVAEKIKALMGSATDPLFVFVITMENHGPLHLEKLGAGDASTFYSQLPPEGCDDLTIYLRHLKNADRMIGDLRTFLRQHPRPARLCWYGDHVPIMPEVYRQLATPAAETAYFVWSNRATGKMPEAAQSLSDLSGCLLDTLKSA